MGDSTCDRHGCCFFLWRVEKQPVKIWEFTDKSRENGTIVLVSPLQIVIKSVYYKYWVYHAHWMVSHLYSVNGAIYMASDFSRTLALLRREKRISQRTAAGDLQVSQALLSHYENGLREPGLSFVVRAADYYGVSCDYLLGRSLSREGSTVVPSAAGAEGTEADPETALQKKLITDSASVLLDAAAKSGSRQLVQELAAYLSAAEYKLFRYLYAADSSNPEEAFRTHAERFDALCDARMKLTELRVQCAANGGGALGLKSEETKLPRLSLAALPEDYPGRAESLLQVLQDVSDSIEEFDPTTKKKK